MEYIVVKFQKPCSILPVLAAALMRLLMFFAIKLLSRIDISLRIYNCLRVQEHKFWDGSETLQTFEDNSIIVMKLSRTLFRRGLLHVCFLMCLSVFIQANSASFEDLKDAFAAENYPLGTERSEFTL